MNQTDQVFRDPQRNPVVGSPYKDVPMESILRRQNTLAALEEAWENNPDSWQTPEDCMWHRGLIQRYEEDYEEITTLLDGIIHFFPSLTEEFHALMKCNLMFKEGTEDPMFPKLLEYEEYKAAEVKDLIETNRNMNLIVQEVIDYMNSQGIPFSTDPSVTSIRKFLPES